MSNRTPKATVRYALMTYPGLYQSPMAVLKFAFCSGSYDWDEDGNLVSLGDEPTGDEVMDFSDLDERAERRTTREYADATRSLDIRWELEESSERMQRQWVSDNIDRILAADLTAVYFNKAGGRHQWVKDISVDYANGLNFPDNINKDWAKVLYEFLDDWLVALNTEYGISPKYVSGPDKIPGGEPMPFWPEDIKKAYKAISAAKRRLPKLIYTPEELAQQAEGCKMILAMLAEHSKKV